MSEAELSQNFSEGTLHLLSSNWSWWTHDSSVFTVINMATVTQPDMCHSSQNAPMGYCNENNLSSRKMHNELLKNALSLYTETKQDRGHTGAAVLYTGPVSSPLLTSTHPTASTRLQNKIICTRSYKLPFYKNRTIATCYIIRRWHQNVKGGGPTSNIGPKFQHKKHNRAFIAVRNCWGHLLRSTKPHSGRFDRPFTLLSDSDTREQKLVMFRQQKWIKGHFR
jgi:hypothetical protein